MENYSREIVNNIKQEPEVHYVLKLSNETESTTEDQDQNISQQLRIILKKFNEKWTEKLKAFDSLFVCSECEFVTHCPFKLSRHLSGYKGGEWPCLCCDQTFATSCGRKKHVSNHFIGSKWHCSKCCFKSSNHEGMRHHYKRHLKKFACQKCDYKFDSAAQLKIHQKKRRHDAYAAQSAIRFECYECQKFYQSKKKLNTHRTNYHGQSCFQCDICGRICTNKGIIRDHMDIHLKLPCELCKVLIARSNISHHLRTVHPSDESKLQKKLSKCKSDKSKTTGDDSYQCVCCDQTFTCLCCRRKHESENHIDDSRFQCSKCSYSSQKRSRLKEHYQQHLKKLSCESCDYKSARMGLLKIHQQRHRHGVFATQPQLKFDCDKCEKTYKTEKGLKIHIKDLHEQRSFECGICGKVFGTKQKTKHHMEIHSKIPCPQCHHMLAKIKLKKHLNSRFCRLPRGTGEVQCDICAKTFEGKHPLRVHMRNHIMIPCKFCYKTISKHAMRKHLVTLHSSGEFILICKITLCKQKFSNVQELNKHQRIHIGPKRYRCPKCKVERKTLRHLMQHMQSQSH